MNTIPCLMNEKLKIHFLSEVFQDSLSIGYIYVAEAIRFNVDINDYSLNQLVMLLLDENELKEKNVLIIESFYLQLNDSDENSIQETLIFNNDVKFELRVISYIKEIEDNDNNFEAGVYARHGNHHKSWWFQNRSYHLRIQIDKSENISSKLSHQQPYMLLYFYVDTYDVESLRDKYLSYLGGKKIQM